MVGSPWIQASICKSLVASPLVSPIHHLQNFIPRLPPKPSKRKLCQVKASSASAGQNPSSSRKGKNPLALVLEVPGTIWKQTLQPLSDFGFGRSSIWDGGVGLLMVSGAALLALALVWLRGCHLRSRFRKYQALFEFSQACGICVGTPVRIRGVTVGSVVQVDSSLKSSNCRGVCAFLYQLPIYMMYLDLFSFMTCSALQITYFWLQCTL